MRQRCERVVSLTIAVVEGSGGCADTAEIETYSRISQRKKSLCECVDDLVIERAAFERMRMRDKRDAGKRLNRRINDNFERADGTVDHFALGRFRRQMRSLSTTLPPTTCESMISSMSSRST